MPLRNLTPGGSMLVRNFYAGGSMLVRTDKHLALGCRASSR
jgi:hypothetical protein